MPRCWLKFGFSILVSLSLFSTFFFASAQSTYDVGLSTSAMYYAAAAYCDPLSLLTWSCGEACGGNPGIFTVRPVVYAETKSFTYGFVTFNTLTNTIIVSFRGTNGVPTSPEFRSLESFLNWETNLDYHQVDYLNVTGAQVHHGFFNSYTTVKTQVRSSVQALLKGFPKSPILVTGHSLGGALATFCAIDLKIQFGQQLAPDQIKLYTFGAPRVGNSAFVDYFTTLLTPGNVFRVVHGNDVVPHVPSLVQKFVHVGVEVWYGSGSTNYRVCVSAPPVYEDPTCSDALLQYGIAEHMVYLSKNITNLCPAACPPGQCLGCPTQAQSGFSAPVGMMSSLNRSSVAVATNSRQGIKILTDDVTKGDKVADSLPRYPLPPSADPRCPNCDNYGCNVTTGVCYHYCSDGNKWWGPTCTNPCTGNCDNYGCNKDTGLCNHYCNDGTKWWGPHCSNQCMGNCDNYGCNKDNGLCNHYCRDGTKWWGPQCDRTCGGHCDNYGCNKDTGYCNHACSDATKWWEPKCCSNPCTGNCDNYGCNINNGLCNHYCSDGTKWWGPHCDQKCMGHCDNYGCNFEKGICNHYCSDGTKWWGIQCDQPCTGNCDNYGCNKDTGLCNHRCNGKFWGPHCENSCAQCDNYGCNRDTGVCNHTPVVSN